MSLINISVKSLTLSEELTIPDDEDGQKSLNSASSKTKLTPQSVQDAIGEFGLFQKLLYFLLWFPAGAMAVGVYASVYMEYVPLYHCVLDTEDSNFAPEYTSTDANMTCWSSESTKCSKWVFDTSVFTSTVIYL